jgi:glutamine amidotransferase
MYSGLGIPVDVATTSDEIGRGGRLLLPGVGAFDAAISRLSDSGMLDAVSEAVLQRQRPILGVCVGMQILADSSEEGELPGLGWIPGRVERLLDRDGGPVRRLPHMGWNEVRAQSDSPLFRELGSGLFYFLHSFHFAPTPPGAYAIAASDYFGEFVSAVGRDHVFGVQFHPEKSHRWGALLLRNFAEL